MSRTQRCTGSVRARPCLAVFLRPAATVFCNLAPNAPSVRFTALSQIELVPATGVKHRPQSSRACLGIGLGGDRGDEQARGPRDVATTPRNPSLVANDSIDREPDSPGTRVRPQRANSPFKSTSTACTSLLLCRQAQGNEDPKPVASSLCFGRRGHDAFLSIRSCGLRTVAMHVAGMQIGVRAGAIATAGRVFRTGDGSAARRTPKIRQRPGVEAALTFSRLAPPRPP
jgi:hypothetical protein